jgi:DNA-binding transcriptional regulator GbsR (MarR family)
MSNDVLAKYTVNDDGGDKKAEYFKLKRSVKVLRRDLKDLKEQHPDYDDLQALKKKVKELNDEIKNDEEIKEIGEKVKEITERMNLLKEMIRIEMIENGENEMEFDGKILKLVYVLKEGKNNDKD